MRPVKVHGWYLDDVGRVVLQCGFMGSMFFWDPLFNVGRSGLNDLTTHQNHFDAYIERRAQCLRLA